jgi:hypothetical protein
MEGFDKNQNFWKSKSPGFPWIFPSEKSKQSKEIKRARSAS